MFNLIPQIKSPGTPCADAVSHFLASLYPCFAEEAKTDFEFSWKLKNSRLEKSGRASCWLNKTTGEDFRDVALALGQLAAPAAVKDAQAGCELPFAQGFGFSASGTGQSYRLYLHSHKKDTGKDVYEAWQWTPDGKAKKYSYAFHFFTPGESDKVLEHLVPDIFYPVLQELTGDSRFRQLSGYWLRYDDTNKVDQVDLCFPWSPVAGSLPGMLLLAKLLRLDAAASRDIAAFPLRHIAFKSGSEAPDVTLYSSAAIDREWPHTEEDLQQRVLLAAGEFNTMVENSVFDSLPLLAAEDGENKIGDFYDGAIATWKQILGPGMHYHAGLFRGEASTEEAAEQAFADAVKSLYPFLPSGGRLYDIGCGWGGPLQLIARDLHCRVLGLTPSVTQYRYLSSLGYNVRLGNAEHTLPPGFFDCVLMLESLCHIADKERLLAVLKNFTRRLVIRLNCQDHSPPSTAFGGSMHMISSAEFYTLLQRTGWQVKHWKNVRQEGLPSVAVWNRRLQNLPPTADRHIETLREWSAVVCTDAEAWGANNPLIEVVADLC